MPWTVIVDGEGRIRREQLGFPAAHADAWVEEAAREVAVVVGAPTGDVTGSAARRIAETVTPPAHDAPYGSMVASTSTR